VSPARHLAWAVRLGAVVALTGIGAGAGGILVAVLLHLLEHLAFGYNHGTLLDGLLVAPPWRRVSALVAAGVFGGTGWWALRRFAAPVVSVSKAVGGARMPAATILANVGLQIGIVGLGASIGREAAPRELGAFVADRISTVFRLTTRERRVLIACGAGAGLAAVYNVPFGGALFTIEILLAELSFATALPAFATAAIAALVARLVVPADPLYTLPALKLTGPLVAFSIPIGFITGLAAAGFVHLTHLLEEHRPRGGTILWVMPVVFTFVGLLSVVLPEILGNGRAAAQTVFTDQAPLLLLTALMLGKTATTSATIGAGAAGGTLTPSIAIGAATGGLLGTLATLIWPGTPLAGYAFLGAAAFLAATMRAPFTATVLALEFTGQGPELFIPAMLAVASAVSIGYLLERARLTGIE
jgi:CIC family chloride channel protein